MHLKQKFFLLLIMLSAATAMAQDSSRLRISLLTCTPSLELYSTFGHSALRIVDSNSVTDMVYNYGTFNFNDEGFYLKFIRGQLLYSLSIDNFYDFKTDYFENGRGIREQELELTGEEKLQLRRALVENMKEENRHYKYDFFLDNCTTRLRDLILKIKHPMPILPAVMPEKFRFRQAIYQYLDLTENYWSKLGIDILLGARTDAVMTIPQQQFLPDNLMIALDKTTNTNIVKSAQQLYPVPPVILPQQWFTPMTVFWSLFVFFALLTFIRHRYIQQLAVFFDGLLFLLVGLLGILLVFMWFGTDHIMTKNNYNLIWALPFHAAAAFFVRPSSEQWKRYFGFTYRLMILLLIAWLFLPQHMNTALLPVVLTLLMRSFSIYKNKP